MLLEAIQDGALTIVYQKDATMILLVDFQICLTMNFLCKFYNNVIIKGPTTRYICFYSTL